VHDALPNHIVVAVVVVERALVVGRRTPRLVGDRLQQDVVAETLRHQAINQSTSIRLLRPDKMQANNLKQKGNTYRVK